MKEFDIQVVLKVTQYTDVIRIEAETEEEAYDIACKMYSDGELNIDEGEDVIEETIVEVNEAEDEIEEEPLKTYNVEISVLEEYTGYTTVQARDEEEANQKATDAYFADEIEMNFTDMEGIKDIKIKEIEGES